MLTKTIYKNINLQKNIKNFSTNFSKILIVGGGTGGVTVANQLVHKKVVSNKDIAIFDPSPIHYYRPGFTKLGGGVITYERFYDRFIRYDMAKMNKNFNFHNVAVQSFQPEQNQVTLSNGETWNYEHLIVSTGLQINVDSVPGLRPLLDDESKFVGTIYLHKYAEKTSRIRREFNGKRAVFTQPPAPITCAGAPQKIMYLCDDHWKSRGLNADIHFVTPLPKMFGIQYYSEKLNEIVKERNYNTHFTSTVLSVDERKVYCQNTVTKEKYELDYDFLHLTPPMSAPDFLKGSPISDQAGFIDVNATMQHKKYSNVWGIGDSTNLPNAKTAAAVFSQAPTLVFNLSNVLHNKNTTASYDGYSACPIFLGNKKLMLAEFRIFNDPSQKDPVTAIDESFHPADQTTPKFMYYLVTKSFFFCYNCALKGIWYGKHAFLYPFNEDGTVKDYRKYYRYILPGLTGLGLFMFTGFINNLS